MRDHPGSQRAGRVGDLLLREMSTLLQHRITDPRLEWVTITAVHVSADLKKAVVFFTARSGVEEAERCQAGLESAAGFIKREIGRSLDLRYMPELRFKYDDSLDQADHLDELLAGLKDRPRESGRED